MAVENRGGARVPDGVARPTGIFGTGANQRTDLSELPGTPGTPLPPSLNEPDIQSTKNALKNLPLTNNNITPGDTDLFGPSSTADPIQAGLSTGPGMGPEGVITGPENTSNSQAFQESLKYYPLMMRLGQTEGLSSQTKAFLRRMRANAPLQPYEMPEIPTEGLT